MRIARELERVRQNDEIERVLGERQPLRVGEYLGGRPRADGPPRGNPALGQKRILRKSDLYGLKAEDVGDRAIEPGLLALVKIVPERRLQPVRQQR